MNPTLRKTTQKLVRKPSKARSLRDIVMRELSCAPESNNQRHRQRSRPEALLLPAAKQ